MKQRSSVFSFFLLVAIGVTSQYAQAANMRVNCDKQESVSKALRLLSKTNPQGPNKITVSGACTDNLVIQSMDRLTLITDNGASITDSSGGTLAVVDIEDSRSVAVQGFTINGGSGGIVCNSASICYLTGNTIQDAVGDGVFVNGSSHAFLQSNVIQNGGNRGSSVSGDSQMLSSNDVFQGNAAAGVGLFGSYFEASNSNVLNNGAGFVVGSSTVLLHGGTISSNLGDGMVLRANTSVAFFGPAITGNGGNGVHLEDGAFAGFVAANVTGNLSGLDVDCEPQFPITRFVDRTGGVTNCVESAANTAPRQTTK
ncbi:MAG: Cell surface glycoprotein [Acidobacteriaceae bacterium]|nr:Cell surface glycoprotein [Acidobacteriaceae bacterium]